MTCVSSVAVALVVLAAAVAPSEGHAVTTAAMAGKFLQARSGGGGIGPRASSYGSMPPRDLLIAITTNRDLSLPSNPQPGWLLQDERTALPGSGLSRLTFTGLVGGTVLYIAIVFGFAIYYRYSRGQTESRESYMASVQKGKSAPLGASGPSLRTFQTLASASAAESQESERAEQHGIIDEGDFSDGLFDVSNDWSIFAWSCFCPCVRWSDTMSKLFLISFFLGVGIWATLLMMNAAVTGLGFCCLVVLGATNRFWIRSDLKMPPRYASDFLAYLCCMPCAVAQEARHVDRLRGLLPAIGSQKEATVPCFTGALGQSTSKANDPF